MSEEIPNNQPPFDPTGSAPVPGNQTVDGGGPRKRGVWVFRTSRGALNVSRAMPCPVCGGDHRCELSAPVEHGGTAGLRAVRCRRRVDKTTGGEPGQTAEGPDGRRYRAIGVKGEGGRVWAPLLGEGDGEIVPAPVRTAEEAAADEAEDQAKKEGNRQLAEKWFIGHACGGALTSELGVDHPMVRDYLKGRGIDPAWFPGGKVPKSLRFCPEWAVWFDYDGKRGSNHPLKRAVKWNAAGECLRTAEGTADRSLDEVEVRQLGPCLVAAAFSRREPGKLLRGVHVTCLKRLADGRVVKNEDTRDGGVAGGRRWLASCDGPIVFPAAGATRETPFPGGVLIAGEGIETTLSVQVSLKSEFTAWAMKSADGLVHMARELAAIPQSSGLHTLIVLVELDKLRTKKRSGKAGEISRTAQRKAQRVIAELAAECPWVKVHARFTRHEDFPWLVELRPLEAGGQEARLAETGELGCACEKIDGDWWEHQPKDPDRGVDWNDLLKEGDCRAAIAAAVMRGVQPAADRAAMEAWIESAEARQWAERNESRDGRRAGEGDAAHASNDGGAETGPGTGGGAGGRRGVAGGGGGGGGGGAVVGGRDELDPEEGRPENTGGPEFWSAPTWGGYCWRLPEDERGRWIISSRGIDRARLFLLQQCRKPGDGRFRLAFWGGVWFWYDGGFWSKVTETQVRGVVAQWISGFWNRRVMEDSVKWTRIDPNERVLAEIIGKLSQECFVSVDRMPAWLRRQIDEDGVPMFGESVKTWGYDPDAPEPRGDPADYLVDREGMIRLSHLVELKRGKRSLGAFGKLPHSPELFTSASRPYVLPTVELAVACKDGWDDAEHERLCPTFMSWLNQAVSDSPCELAMARKKQLGMMFGDSISGNRELEIIHMLPGPRRAGKGVLLRAIIASHGRGAVAATTLTKLGTQFGLFPLVGASVGVMGDAHVGQFADSTQAVENLKSIRGNDPVQVEGKNLHPQTLELGVRFWIFCNDEPDKLQDNSGAFSGSLVMWPLTQSFYGEEDPSIKRKVKDEGPGIAVWALAHYAELFAAARPRIDVTELAREISEEFEDASSHMVAFAKDCLVWDEVRGRQVLKYNKDREVELGAAHNVYTNWCIKHDRRPVGKNKFVGRLRPLVNGGLRKSQPTADDGSRKRVIQGIELRGDLPAELTQGSLKPAAAGTRHVVPSARAERDDPTLVG